MAETTEEHTARLEGLIEQMDKRLTNIEGEIVRIPTRIDQLIIQTNTRFDQANTKFDQVNNKIDQKFNWLMGIMITMWVTIFITMIFRR